MCVQFYAQTQQDIHTAEELVYHIAGMDLESARAVSPAQESTSVLQSSLFQIVANLEIYRPYLPDSLFDKVRTGSGRRVDVRNGLSAGEEGQGRGGIPSICVD